LKEKLPRDINAECGIIGSLILKPEFVLHTPYLKPFHFYEHENGCIFWAINELMESGVNNIDDFNIITKLEGEQKVKNVFDNLDIPSIQDFIENAKYVGRTTLEEYKLLVDRIINLSYKRNLHSKLNDLSKLCFNENINGLSELNLTVQEELANLAEKYVLDKNIQTLGERIDNIWEEIQDRRTGSGLSGFPSKYPLINEYFTYETGELIIIGGRAKAGKSILLMNEAEHKIRAGVPTAILDTEMSTRQWTERFLSKLTGIKVRNIKSGNYGSTDEKILKDAIQWIKNQNFVHIYDPDWTKDKIYTTAKILKIKMGLEFLIYDYIKVNDSSSLNQKEHNVLGDYANFLKNKIGGEMDIAVLSAGQMSPYDTRLADSDKLNRYASVVAYWIKKDDEEIGTDGEQGGNYKLNIDYNRLGGQMEKNEAIYFNFNGDIANIEQAHYQMLKDTPEFLK